MNKAELMINIISSRRDEIKALKSFVALAPSLEEFLEENLVAQIAAAREDLLLKELFTEEELGEIYWGSNDLNFTTVKRIKTAEGTTLEFNSFSEYAAYLRSTY